MTTSGTWVAPKTDWYKVTVIAGGGGGGQGGVWSSTAAGTAWGKGGGAGTSSGGGGGGAGQVIEKYLHIAAGTAISYIIGSGGTGGKVSNTTQGLVQEYGAGGGRTGGKAGTRTGCGGYGGRPGGSFPVAENNDAGRGGSGGHGSHPCYVEKFTGATVVTPFNGFITGSGGNGGTTCLVFGGGGGGGAGSSMRPDDSGVPGCGADGGLGGYYRTGTNAGAFGGDGAAGAILIEYDSEV